MTEHWFIVPPLEGPPSGGTLYNRELLRELTSAGCAVRAIEPSAALQALETSVAGVYWVDSIFLGHFEGFWRANRGRRPLGLLAHYLPSLVEQSDDVAVEGLRRDETFALAHCAVALAPSAYMKRALIKLGLAAPAPCLVVEPGCLAQGLAAEAPRHDGVRALIVANLTPGKGVAPFLRSLASELRPDDAFELSIVGRLDDDAAYAHACLTVAQGHAALARRVSFRGGLSPAQVGERLLASNLLISASRMESFGIAIAEARTVGVPVVGLARGNVPGLVSPSAGGVLAENDQALALACVALARNRPAHARALELARAHPRQPRSFAEAARDFSSQMSAIDLAGRA